MSHRGIGLFRRWRALAIAAAAAAGLQLGGAAQPAAGPLRVAATEGVDLRAWDGYVDRLAHAGALRLVRTREDTLIPGRVHDRFDQYHRGVRVFGAAIARQVDALGTLSIFGTLHEAIDVDPTPRLTPAEARALVEREGRTVLPASREPELVILPLDAGGYALAYHLRAFSPAIGVRSLPADPELRGPASLEPWRPPADARSAQPGVETWFIDALDGRVLRRYDDLRRQVGTARGVFGDVKKLSARAIGDLFFADDGLRPPSLLTYDLRGNVIRAINLLDGVYSPSQNDVASARGNNWTDGAVVDAHVYAGLTYDYWFKRFGRRGIDNNNLRMLSLVHPVRRQDIFDYDDDVIALLYLNAFYCGECGPDGNGMITYGEGLPPGFVLTNGQTVDFFSGALDVVAHELTHGITEHTSQLIYLRESGALDEAFSDIIGTGTEFFFQAPGSDLLKADYLIGEDILRPGGNRSLADPLASAGGRFPDHYSRLFTGTDDNGGVHINSTIATHAFYLAIEGGTNRTSGRSVQGVGSGQREQIERAFYRAFVFFLPPDATFAVARRATIQAARELFGSGSAAERAMTQAWDAVGVF